MTKEDVKTTAALVADAVLDLLKHGERGLQAQCEVRFEQIQERDKEQTEAIKEITTQQKNIATIIERVMADRKYCESRLKKLDDTVGTWQEQLKRVNWKVAGLIGGSSLTITIVIIVAKLVLEHLAAGG